ncbi:MULTISPECIES: AAA family ATPase [Rhodococcus]|uniref:AAA family ATPase n=1 Tax=Rhodococcus TaxID=1827 RepID=UPI001E435E45|nr:AAA family ATPase [Rhodococcus pyridinivorans]MCD2119432.1 AAA family ATPase [Rhodococcus pyridinivorans]MCZ4628333.1 AAA family ATPase [Rhodococcus pyridinivorans]MCZ4649598.1 AAA family ATPase [Rhodococcus pyridinivorans]MDJ0483680.1 AAA family ATPase [Rhodococcus pyridinivorans]MDV7255669.1 AAA family ATPase [Rhodococcus pyridinivorans]
MPDLTRIRVKGLLGRFDHDVFFPEGDSFVILHGPNGVGKTHLLQLTQAVLSGELWRCQKIRFEVADFNFSDGHRLQVWRHGWKKNERHKLRSASALDRQIHGRGSVQLMLFRGGGLIGRSTGIENEKSELKSAQIRKLLEVELGLDRVGFDEWLDPRADRYLTTEEALSRYLPLRPGRLADILASLYGIPKELSEFLVGLSVKFVQTQRLLIADDAGVYAARRRPARTRESTVAEFSRDIARIISDKLAENARISSQLDRTFPKRVLERRDEPKWTTNELLDQYREQTLLRNRLAEVSLLDSTTDITLEGTELNATEMRVLETYLDDTAKKLGVLNETLQKITLLRDIINRRFLYKTMRIDASEGFIFETDEGEQISPDQLSSGEQHELVLLYELLFRTTFGSLVLIDEPEISLHVGWQREFLNDLQNIALLSNARFIVATHSPQIVDKWRSKAVYLAPDEERN